MTPIYKLNIKFKSAEDSHLQPLDLWTHRTLFFATLEETARAEVALKCLGAVTSGYTIDHLCTVAEALEYVAEIMTEEGK